MQLDGLKYDFFACNQHNGLINSDWQKPLLSVILSYGKQCNRPKQNNRYKGKKSDRDSSTNASRSRHSLRLLTFSYYYITSDGEISLTDVWRHSYFGFVIAWSIANKYLFNAGKSWVRVVVGL